MNRYVFGAFLGLLLIALPAWAADGKFAVKAESAQPPKELKDPVRSLLGEQALVVLDAKKEIICQIWFRKELPGKAKPEDLAKGLTYRNFEESLLVGAVQFPKQWLDFRKQKIKPGVYTLRVGFQPMDGDHMGSSPHTEFLVLCPAAKDTSAGKLETKALNELSSQAAASSHPAVILLFPNPKPEAGPAIAGKANDIWVLNCKLAALAGSAKAALGLSMTIHGHAAE